MLHEPRVIIRYTLVDAHSETTLRLRPQLAFRNVNELTQRNNQVNYNYEVVENGIGSCLYQGYPTLYMQLSKENQWHSHPDWNIGVEYPREQVRGYGYKEDLFMPGYFEFSIKKGESVVFSGGITPIKHHTVMQTRLLGPLTRFAVSVGTVLLLVADQIIGQVLFLGR